MLESQIGGCFVWHTDHKSASQQNLHVAYVEYMTQLQLKLPEFFVYLYNKNIIFDYKFMQDSSLYPPFFSQFFFF